MKVFSPKTYKSSTKAIFGSLVLASVMVLTLAALSVIGFWAASLLIMAISVGTAIAAYRIHVGRLEQKNRQMAEFNRVHLATIEALATAIDARDQIGVGHVRRTQSYAVGLGELLGLGESDIDALRTAALLHDIGKLAVPDHILNKPGSLTTAEMEKARIYPVVGASILENVGFDNAVVPTVKYQHERWDGKGYPKRLSGNDIPLTARILSVADAYDTLRETRPYRAAISRDTARQMMLENAGKQFDPAIVQMLIKNLGTLETAAFEGGLAYATDRAPHRSDGAFVEQIKLANREAFSLYELAREFSSSVTLSETLEMFAKKVGEFVPFDTCALYLLEPQKNFATATHVEGNNAAVMSLRRIKVGQGATGFTLKSGETVQNVEADLDFAYSHNELLGEYTALASVPLVADGELLGAVTIYSSTLESYDDDHIRLLETISRIAADAIGKSLVHDEAKTHALTDPMTGLPNGRSLQKQFDKEVARAGRSDTTFQLLMLDLDGFKAVNDSFGHKVGDEVLRQVSQVIQGQLRDYDFLARYGGDEFVALVPETEPGDVDDLCQRIERAVSDFALRIDDENSARVGVSLGASGYPRNGETFDQMIVAADKAMYERKVARKRRKAAETSPLVPAASVYELTDEVLNDTFIVELDESHVMSAMVN
jgi:diguanylate cyclase (GGDEF)-like protein